MDKPEKHAGGRPTSLTLDVRRAIIESLRDGATISVSCSAAGISRQTFYDWIKRGQAEESPFKEFIDICERVIAESEISAVASIRAAGKKNWKALAWLLSRRHRRRWGSDS